MSYIFLQELGEESSAESFADIPASVLSRLNLTHERYCCNGNATESCRDSQSGTTCKHLTADHGEARLTSFAVDSPARTSAQPVKERDSAGSGLDCGPRWPGSFARLDPNTSSWKTHQFSLLGGLESFSETWPRWGMMRDGECWDLISLEPIITAPESGWLPTPTCADSKNAGGRQNQYDLSKHARVITGKRLSVHYSEWTMDWPHGWTDITPLGTDKFQAWLDSHGKL
jgi:hypothetical protein